MPKEYIQASDVLRVWHYKLGTHFPMWLQHGRRPPSPYQHLHIQHNKYSTFSSSLARRRHILPHTHTGALARVHRTQLGLHLPVAMAVKATAAVSLTPAPSSH